GLYETDTNHLLVVLIVGGGLALHAARAQHSGTKGTDRTAAPTTGSTQSAPVRETVTVGADEPIPNLPGKRLVTHIVDSPRRGNRPRTVTPLRLSSTPTSFRARYGARSMTNLSASTDPVKRGSRSPAPIIE